MNTTMDQEATKVPETEASARRLREITSQMREMAEGQEAMTDERVKLMLELHQSGWNNVQIANAAGLTRARVSSILKPILDAKAAEKVAAG